MRLYNTMTRQKQEFIPVEPGKVGMYACGITAYDYCHIGHARSAVFFDVLARYMRFKGLQVTFVRNFTDVDDKIITRANKDGVESQIIAERFMEAFHEDMDKLAVLRADVEPRATEYIGEMIDICKRLIAKGHAYAVPSGDVYFKVRSFSSYGKLSGRDVDDMRSGARVAPGEEKEDPLDFALWKAAKPGEPSWESPWGLGRPGWHIECSAMSEKNLPLPLDIHGGGQDLIFPHHENEIAQSEAALDKNFANYWVHNGFVQINSEKMSKSLGNFTTIRTILEERLPEVLRFFLLGKHYRSPIDYNIESLDEAERGLKRIYECDRDISAALLRSNWKKGAQAEASSEFAKLKAAFFEAMEDDCNTAGALGHVFGMARLMNRILEDKNSRALEGTKELCLAWRECLVEWRAILGVFQSEATVFLADLRNIQARRAHIDEALVEVQLAARADARATKDFAQADKAREALKEMGVEVRDTPQGQVWDIM